MVSKVVYIYLILFIFVGVFIGGKYYLETPDRNIQNIKSNSVYIIKNAKIIKKTDNLKAIIKSEKNIEKSKATGFYIANNLIITAGHLVNKNQKKYNIVKNKYTTYSGSLVYYSEELDIAIMKMPSYKNFKQMKYGSNFKISDLLKSFGLNTEKNILETKKGEIKNIINNKIISNIVFENGNSGGPLLNKTNEIIGINLEVDLLNKEGISLILTKKIVNELIKKATYK